MLWGRYASQASEARYPQLWQGRVFAACPSVQGPAGLNLYDLSGGGKHGTLVNMSVASDWLRSGGQYALNFAGTRKVTHTADLSSAARRASLCLYGYT